MPNREQLNALSKEELIQLIQLYSKNWLALDGVWFQSVERKYGMEEAMFHDAEAWKTYTVTEARRIKAFLDLPERAGLEGLRKSPEVPVLCEHQPGRDFAGRKHLNLPYNGMQSSDSAGA